MMWSDSKYLLSTLYPQAPELDEPLEQKYHALLHSLRKVSYDKEVVVR